MRHTGAAAFRPRQYDRQNTPQPQRSCCRYNTFRQNTPQPSLPQRHVRKQRTPTDDKRPKHKHTTSQITDNETRNHLHARSARLQRSPAGGLRHPARTPGKIPLVPALPAPDDLRRGPDSAAADSRMAGAHRRSRTRHLARPPRLDGRSASRRGRRFHRNARKSLSGALSAGSSPDRRRHGMAGHPHPPAAARRRNFPDRRLYARPHTAGNRFVLLPAHHLRLGQNACRGAGRHSGPRVEPHRPPPLHRTHPDGADEGPSMVEPLRMDRRTAADRGRRVRGRQRRAEQRLRPRRIYANHLQAAFRL